MTEVLAASFRDPSGFVFSHEDTLYRQINARHRDHYDRLMASGLYERLVDGGLLVAHREVDTTIAPAPGAYRVIRPERIPFVSYPYEWCFSQLKAAALATLEAQELALGYGMSLRDASAYNVQFVGHRPVLIDTLSFETLPEGRPWVAYRQFCQHFLAPLALISHTDVRLSQLLRIHLDGIPLDLAATLLPVRSRLRPGLLLHLHQHARSQQRHAASHAGRPSPSTFSSRAFHGLIESLRTLIGHLDWQPGDSPWVDYYEGDSYSEEAFEHKRALVGEYLDVAQPRSVWDLGANTGAFSRLAAERGAYTIAFEVDPASVEASFRRMAAEENADLLPLVLDLTNPSPALGWAHRERDALADRGPADLVMALALVHHLAIANNLPLDRIARFLRDLAEWLVIEFIPKSDPKAQLLLASREDVFDVYTQDRFEAAVGATHTIERRDQVRSSQRTLYLLRRR